MRYGDVIDGNKMYIIKLFLKEDRTKQESSVEVPSTLESLRNHMRNEFQETVAKSFAQTN